ncbi:MAG: cache domain-containing protein, partial [Rhodospirillaceae bacterium]
MPYGEVERKRTGGRLIAFSLLLLLGINGFFAATLWVSWHDRLDQARQHSASLAEGLAAQADATVSGTDRLLSSLAEVLTERMSHHNGGKLVAEDPDVTALLRRRVPRNPHMRAITLIAPDGTVLNDSRDPEAAHVNLADRDYFTDHRDGGPERTFIDRPEVSRTDGRWFIGMSHRVTDLNGQFAGVVNAVVDPDYFRRFFATLGIDDGGFAALFDRTGTIFAREPDFQSFV